MKIDINILIAKVLSFGVLLSLLLFVVAILETFLFHSHYLNPSFCEVVSKSIMLNAQNTFYAGIIILMLTPVVGVFLLAIGYFLEKDYRFSIISTLVLIILLFSIYLGLA